MPIPPLANGRPEVELQVPSPILRFSSAELGSGELWVKDDGQLNPLYSGNKARNLGRCLSAARAAGTRRILTAGGAGSHHVLATTLFARRCGLATTAVLTPQPWTHHAEQTLACALAWGLEPIPVATTAEVPLTALEHRQRGDVLVPIGGWGTLGSLAHAEAVEGLSGQIQQGSLPVPDCIVVALGSGGTASGILAGLACSRPGASVRGISVFARHAWLARAFVVPLAAREARRIGQQVGWRELDSRLLVTSAEVSAGYGRPTPSTATAQVIAARQGLTLDTTHTAKAFAAALRILDCSELTPSPAERPASRRANVGRAPVPIRVLYSHTLSRGSLEPLLAEAPGSTELPSAVRSLFHRA
ncbi:MAG: pyridoxal-phosphate dependent enzyme [Polyangiaceae bacterium]|nr:pyridoxal-phosphate dependent enzyme [Polyangiaceae bacterium]